MHKMHYRQRASILVGRLPWALASILANPFSISFPPKGPSCKYLQTRPSSLLQLLKCTVELGTLL